jgi:DNA polymerase I-like protein with 3'-5' exonuclease and polymerase domains
MYQLPLIKPDSDWRRPSVLPDLRGRPLIAMDSEEKDDGLANDRGPGWVHKSGYICGVSMAADGIAVYAPIRHPEGDCFDEDAVRRWVDDHLRSSTPVVFHNGPYDLGWFRAEWDIRPPDNLHDSLAAAFILDETRFSYSLDSVCRWLGVAGKDEQALREAALAYRGESLKGPKSKKITDSEIKSMIWRLPARYVGPYAEQDATASLEAMKKMLPRLKEDGLEEAYQLEIDLIPLVLEMKLRGIRINLDTAEKNKRLFLQRRDESLAVLSDKLMIGRAVTMKDVGSHGFLERVFTDLKIQFPRTAAGNSSFETEWLEKIDHWLPQNIARASNYNSAATKFVENYIQSYTHMGRIHADVHQFRDEIGGTRTYRFSYSSPPLQQMPARDEEIAPLIRDCFMPEEGEYWFAPDYSQQEYRLIVHFAYVCHMAGVEKALQMYNDDPKTDFHNLVVKLTGLSRPRAKDCNFAKSYGAGKDKFSLMTGLPVEECVRIMKQYDDEMPFVARLNEFCDGRAQVKGFIKTLDGARIRFDRWEPRWLDRDQRAQGWREKQPMEPCSKEEAVRRCNDPKHVWCGAKLKRADTRKAMNGLIQGSAARQTKMAMRACWRDGITPMIQMHDELGISTADPRVVPKVVELMHNVVKLTVPMRVDAEFGPTWGRAKYHDWDEMLAECGRR